MLAMAAAGGNEGWLRTVGSCLGSRTALALVLDG